MVEWANHQSEFLMSLLSHLLEGLTKYTEMIALFPAVDSEGSCICFAYLDVILQGYARWAQP